MQEDRTQMSTATCMSMDKSEKGIGMHIYTMAMMVEVSEKHSSPSQPIFGLSVFGTNNIYDWIAST